MRRFLLISVLCPVMALGAHPKTCVPTDAAPKMLNKEICLSAHVYEVVQLPDGTRFLDVCPPTVRDEQCLFTVVSFREDHDDVGELNRYRDLNVEIRGIVQPMHGRAGIVLSHMRQFHGGPPKFRPNPRLLHGFSGDQSRPPVSDPNLRPQGGHRAFMNSADREPLSPDFAKQK